MERKAQWDAIYATKPSDSLSWYQPEPAISLRLLEAAGIGTSSCVLDVGGGDSRLVDRLLARGLTCITVLDISGAALARARARLGAQQSVVTWLEADVTGDWKIPPVDAWHDRAVFHFLTDALDRSRYIAQLRQTLKPAGAAVIATFGLDGPPCCSGLPVIRYSATTLAAELGADFTLMETLEESHQTPSGGRQSFLYTRFRRN